MSKTITKKSLVETIADNTGQRRSDVKRTLQEFLDQIVAELGEGNRIEFRDFGVFEVKQRAARIAQNPRTLERVAVPAKRTVKFKPGRKMKDVLDQVAEASDVVSVIGSIDSTSHAAATNSRAKHDTRAESAPEVHVANHQFVHAGHKEG